MRNIEDSKRSVLAMTRKRFHVLLAADSNPVEFRSDSVVLDVNGKIHEIPNDFVWIFAGGEPPTAFLKKIGVGFGAQDLTISASKEAKAVKEAALVLR